MTYAEKLKDPRWQKLRLEVLERDDFTCLMCGDKNTELHVHHDSYSNTRNPWNTGIGELTTLCKHCHALEEYTKKTYPIIFGHVFKTISSNKFVKLYAISFFGGGDVYIFNYKDGVISFESHIPHHILTNISTLLIPKSLEDAK